MRQLVRLKRLGMLSGAALLLIVSGAPVQAAKWFVDNALGEVKAEEKAVPSKAQPVQLLFEFQRDAGPNPKATKLTKPWATDYLKQTGAFSEIVETPTANGAVLSIKFNNIVKKEEIKAAKGDAFKAGMGFGLFGGVVATDYYEVTMEYLPGPGAAPISTVVKHQIHMKYGKKDVQIPGTEVKNITIAVQTAMRQALARGVNNIAADPRFPK